MINQEPLSKTILRALATSLAFLVFLLSISYGEWTLLNITFIISTSLITVSIFIYSFGREKFWWAQKVSSGSILFFLITCEIDLFISVLQKTINIKEFLVCFSLLILIILYSSISTIGGISLVDSYAEKIKKKVSIVHYSDRFLLTVSLGVLSGCFLLWYVYVKFPKLNEDVLLSEYLYLFIFGSILLGREIALILYLITRQTNQDYRSNGIPFPVIIEERLEGDTWIDFHFPFEFPIFLNIGYFILLIFAFLLWGYS